MRVVSDKRNRLIEMVYERLRVLFERESRVI